MINISETAGRDGIGTRSVKGCPSIVVHYNNQTHSEKMFEVLYYCITHLYPTKRFTFHRLVLELFSIQYILCFGDKQQSGFRCLFVVKMIIIKIAYEVNSPSLSKAN